MNGSYFPSLHSESTRRGAQALLGTHLIAIGLTAGTLLVGLGLTATTAMAASPAPTTREDFRLPGTQPLTITSNLALPGVCASCHSNFGAPLVEPTRNWQGSMMAQSGRDPITYAAMAVANQDAPHSGEMCIRCHMPKGWLEGRSTPEDASSTTADDRQGVQCSACHRLVDPAGNPGAPAEDAAIVAALAAPVTRTGGAQMVVDPSDRLRGPFNIIADLGSDPHLATRSTLVSPWHRDSRLCGTCHNVLNPVFQWNPLAGAYELGTFDTAGDPTLAFPEQQTFDEWQSSDYAAAGVDAPQFAGNGHAASGSTTVASCQDCHMPAIAGRAASAGATRPDVPLHEMVGANTFAPTIIPMHPVFGAEVDADVLSDGAAKSLRMLRRAATVGASIASGVLTVRVTNESGHKLPTGYPDGRRMWLHVRALDGDGNVVFESGRYAFDSADLSGYGASAMDPGYDPSLHVWETRQGISTETALATGQVAGPSFHLALNSVREFDNRIPPRGFTNAAYEAIRAEPVGQTYADGQFWDDVSYPIGAGAVRAEVTLYYQTTTKEYVEFLRDENITTVDGDTLLDLWTAADMGPPVEMARVMVDSNPKVLQACRKTIDKLQAKYFKSYVAGWGACYASEAGNLPCDDAALAVTVDTAASALREALGGAGDKRCAGADLTPGSLGLGSYCPAPCASIVLFDVHDVADCAICLVEGVGNAALEAAYGTTPPLTPAAVPFGAASACQQNLASSALGLASKWASTLQRCETANASGKNDPPADCSTDPSGKIAAAKTAAASRVDKCTSFSGIAGCALSAVDNAAAYSCIEGAIEDAVAKYPATARP